MYYMCIYIYTYIHTYIPTYTHVAQRRDRRLAAAMKKDMASSGSSSDSDR